MITDSSIATSKKVALTITLPTINFQVLVKKITTLLSELFSNIYNPINRSFTHTSENVSSRAKRMQFPKIKKPDFNKKNFKIILPIIIGIIVIAAIINIARSLPDAQSKASLGASNPVSQPDTLGTINLNRKFVFPLKDAKDKNVGNFDYVIESVNIQKQIIVQGQRATAVNKRVFLILNLKITNNLKQMIKLNTRDYLRLVVESASSEQLAPDIHNDPVEVQAISTKYTRVGVAIDEADARKKIQLKVGEIDGTKQNIDLNFKF